MNTQQQQENVNSLELGLKELNFTSKGLQEQIETPEIDLMAMISGDFDKMAESTKYEVEMPVTVCTNNKEQANDVQLDIGQSFGINKTFGTDFTRSQPIRWEDRENLPFNKQIDFTDPIFNLELPTLKRQEAMNFNMDIEDEDLDDFEFELPVLKKQCAMNFTEYAAAEPRQVDQTELNINIKFELDIEVESMQNSINIDNLIMIESKYNKAYISEEFNPNVEIDQDESEFDMDKMELPTLKRQNAMNFLLPPYIQDLLNKLLKDLSPLAQQDQKMSQSIFQAQEQIVKHQDYIFAKKVIDDMSQSGQLMNYSQNNMEMSTNVMNYQKMCNSIALYQ